VVYGSLWKTYHKATERYLLYRINCFVCHLTQLNEPILDFGLHTPEKCKAELTSVLVIYLDGLPVRR